MTLFSPIPLLLSGSGDPTFWAALGAASGVYLFYRGFRKLQRKRLILNVPLSKVRSASMGLVEVNGHAIGPYTIRSPLCLEPCYYYKTIAWQMAGSGRDRSWKKVAEEALHMPFFVDDGSGRVLVDPAGAEMDLHRDFHEEYNRLSFGSSDPLPDAARRFLASHGVAIDSSLRLDEYLIRPGTPLYVMGTLATNPGLDVRPMPARDLPSGMMGKLQQAAGAAMQASETAELVAQRNHLPPDEQEHIFRQQFAAALGFQGLSNFTPVATRKHTPADRSQAAAAPKAGASASPLTDEEKHRRELFKASLFGTPLPGAPAPREVRNAPEVKPEDFDLHPPVVLMKGEREQTFFISQHSQREVVARLALEATLCIWGGPLLTLVAVAYLVTRYAG
jgi:hypothetical protein